jgi:hypothetical protein
VSVRELIREYEREHGVTVIRAVLADGVLTEVKSVPIAPDDLAIQVYNMRAALVRRVDFSDGSWMYKSVLPDEAYDDRVLAWLARAVERAGGAITWSGLYPCPRLPKWLKAKLIAETPA